MLRKVLAAFVGLIAAVIIFTAFEAVSGKLYPLPEGADIADHEAMEAHVRSLPTGAFLIVLAGWAVGSFACGVLIRIISKSGNKTPAYIAGLLLTTAGIVNMFTVPHPTWFIVAGLLIFIPATLLGHAVLKNK